MGNLGMLGWKQDLRTEAINRLTTNGWTLQGESFFLEEIWFVVAQFIAHCVSPVGERASLLPKAFQVLKA